MIEDSATHIDQERLNYRLFDLCHPGGLMCRLFFHIRRRADHAENIIIIITKNSLAYNKKSEKNFQVEYF